ncbi:eCIS core domain-containing protein [Archangium lansingense]|uniref:DUF4157 domain-containing protein n=1 Tax=Archangium lansingense TaxID=2995310 RepID=A0ABT4AAM7_9BACT|nr:DUF4157 domain-containing protein [Archangium lansinium]MCY1078713.1 DUF4157 domain-containing protein [Archangium lansinium]
MARSCSTPPLGVSGKPVRAKLSVGRVEDPAERAADALATQVLRMPDPSAGPTGQGHHPGTTAPAVRRMCQECTEQEDEQTVRPKQATASVATTAAPASVEATVRSPGAALDASARAHFQPRFGHDFSKVRVHADETADASAREIGALAYTVGSHIVFARGRYSPRTSEGQRLLAHELAHVVQEGHAPQRVRRQIGHLPVSAAGASATGATATSETGDRSSADQAATGGAGGGEAPIGTCRVDVRATFISSRWMPFRHLFIVHEDAAGNVTAYRGGPGGPGGTPPYGTITGRHGPYRPGFIDWDPGAPSVRVASGSAACGKDSCFRTELARISGAGIPYAPTGPNSNTVVRTLLHNCGLPEQIPVSSLRVPGWGHAYI